MRPSRSASSAAVLAAVCLSEVDGEGGARTELAGEGRQGDVDDRRIGQNVDTHNIGYPGTSCGRCQHQSPPSLTPSPDPMPPAPRPYHHGNLREALIEAGVGLARAGGPDAVVLREASRQVGVSHNAGYRHFPDRDALLAAVGERAMEELAELMERLIGEIDPAGDALEVADRRLRATGAAYVRFALTEPGLFRTAFAAKDEMPTVSGSQEDLPGPFRLLVQGLDAVEAAGGMPEDRRPGAEIIAWSAVHGISLLLLDGPLRSVPAAERDAVIGQVLDAVQRSLSR